MSDLVCVRGLELDTVIGVYGWEREVRQRLVVDLEMAWDMAPAAASDAVEHALDYAAVSSALRDYAAAQSFQLIETLAEGLAGLVLQDFGVPWLRLRLSKPGAVVEARDVGVVIERGVRPS